MQNPIITKETFLFLKELEKNNNREWFGDNKPKFKAIESDVKAFYAAAMENLKLHDEIEKMKTQFLQDLTNGIMDFGAIRI